MISFRFHVVSITAVFLAIAIGVVVGTTYVDRAVVDSLENRVDRVSRQPRQRKAENDALEAELGPDLRGYAGASADFAVDRPPRSACRCCSSRCVGSTTTSPRRRSTLVPTGRRRGPRRSPGWRSRWALEGDDDHDALATAAGVDPSSSDTEVRNAALAALIGALGCRPRAPTPPTRTPCSTGWSRPGFLSVDAQDDAAPPLVELAGRAPRVARDEPERRVRRPRRAGGPVRAPAPPRPGWPPSRPRPTWRSVRRSQAR